MTIRHREAIWLRATPRGQETTTTTEALKAGAEILQDDTPADELDIALWDGNTENATLNGIEYIISESLFECLPAHERGQV